MTGKRQSQRTLNEKILHDYWNACRVSRGLKPMRFKLKNGSTITFKPTSDADKLRGAPNLKGCAWPGPEVDS